MEQVLEGFVNIRDWIPQNERPVKLKTKHGNREAVLGRFFTMGGFYLTDCTHPVQNCHMSIFDVISWKYKNKEDFEDYPPIKNTWMRQAEADSLLREVERNKPKWKKTKIYQWLIKVLK